MLNTLSDYDFELPEALIAQQPVAGSRDQSRLLVVDRSTGALTHRQFFDITEYLQKGDLLVFNNSRVIPARLYGRKAYTGGMIELLLIRPVPEASISPDRCVWEAMIHWKQPAIGTECEILDEHGNVRLNAWLLKRSDEGGTWLVECEASFEELEKLIEDIGHMPIPPYIHNNQMSETELRDRYQTVYASVTGSIAAPTAGLHFTPKLLEQLGAAGVEQAEVTLHVGLGTFKPVKVEDISKHVMHSEEITISEEAAAKINKAKSEGRRVIAVGTTAVRALESFAVADSENGSKTTPPITRLESGTKRTSIFITPGYQFRIIDGMVTNFHVPKSTLLILVSAFAGRENILHAYEEAIREKYRFYSFGDAMLIL